MQKTPPQKQLNIFLELYKLKRYEEAEKIAIKITKNFPNFFFGWKALGVIFKKTGKITKSLAANHKALQINPNDPETFFNLANTFKDLNKAEEAIINYKKAINLKPDYLEACNNLGIILREQKKLKESEESYKKAIKLNPNFADAYNNLGYTLRELGRLDESESSYNKAIELNPNFAEAYNNLGFVLKELGRLDESESSYNIAINLKPDFADAYNNLSLTLLSKGNFQDAFKLSEWRWKTELKIGEQFYSNKPYWDGENNCSVFVWREQGIGDEIMYCSILPELIEKSKKVILNCDERLIPLFKRSLPDKVTFESKQNNINEDKYDFHIPMGSLPLHFRKDLTSFNRSSNGYLKANKVKTIEFRKQLSDKKNIKIIGLSWHTKSLIQMASFRNIPLKNLVYEINNSEIKFISLQYGDTSEEIQKVKKELGVDIIDLKEVDKRDDIDNLAALVSACDLVVSIDNFILHLAGSLGVKTKALLPFSSDSRWGHKNDKCHLYDSVYLYRQNSLGDWKKVLKQLKEDIIKIN